MNHWAVATLFASIQFASAIPSFDPNAPLLGQLQHHQLWQSNTPLKLHLGCGEWHMDGYVNIDFPPSEHPVMHNLAADIFGNILQLNFPNESADEIRSHHAFEHFDRQEALALLCNWHQALKIGGILYIETPDFEESIKILLYDGSLSYKDKQAVIRHIFGSHEAPWAIHCDGWYREKFIHVLSLLDFEIVNIDQTYWSNICNIHVTARKKSHQTREHLIEVCKQILLESMVHECEEPMWQIWCNQLKKLVF